MPEPEVDLNTLAAALTENHLRDAVRLVRERYGADERGARQWLVLAFVEALGLPENASYPIIDYLGEIRAQLAVGL